MEGLRPALAKGDRPSAVAISSNSTTTAPNYTMELVEALLAGDEPRRCAWPTRSRASRCSSTPPPSSRSPTGVRQYAVSDNEELFIYIAATPYSVNTVIVVERENVQ